MSWPPPLYLTRPHLPWSLDATLARVSPEQIASLPWEQAFDLLESTARGEHVNTSEDRAVGHGWLRAPETAPSLALAQEIQGAIDETMALADALRTGSRCNSAGERFTDLLHIGIGGSLLGPELLVTALGDDPEGHPRGLRVHFIDNIDPNGLHQVVGALRDRLARTVVVIVSKSGSTVEPNAALAYVWQTLLDVGLDPAQHLVAITGNGSILDQRAKAEGWMASLPLWSWVGGRFSTTSPVGLFTAGCAGLDTAALLAGAAAMDAWCRTRDPLENPAALLAGCAHRLGAGRGERALVTLPYLDRLKRLGRWAQQVVMESIGKSHDREGREVRQGLTVFGTKGSTDQHAYVQQLRDGQDSAIVLFVQAYDTGVPPLWLSADHTAGDALQGFFLGTRRALRDANRPSLTVSLERLDEHALGGLVALFERFVELYAGLIGVNAYDQPGVEAGKQAAKELLAVSRQLLAALADGPATTEDLAQRVGAAPLEVHWLLRRLQARGDVAGPLPNAPAVWRLRQPGDGRG